jgi:Flp pilus assembly protein TadG
MSKQEESILNRARIQVSARRRKSSRGNTVLETALVGLVFFSLLIGAFDFGQFLFVHQALVERARLAARWGAINDPTNHTATSNMVLYNQSTQPAGGAGYFNLTAGNVAVTDPDVNTNNYRLNVVISGYTYNMFSPYFAGTYTGPRIMVSVPLGPYD